MHIAGFMHIFLCVRTMIQSQLLTLSPTFSANMCCVTERAGIAKDAYLHVQPYSCSCSLTCFLQDYFSRFLLTFSDSSTCGVTVKWGERGDGPEIEIETRATCSRDWAWIYIWLRVYLGSGRIKQLHGNIGLFPIIAAVTGFTNQFLLPMAFSQRKHKLNQKKVQRKCVDVYSFCFHPLSSTLFTSDTLLHTQFHSVSTTIDCWAAGGLRLCCSEHQW